MLGVRTCLLLLLASARTAAMHQKVACAVANEGEEIVFDCGGDLISEVEFGSFGRPMGTCEAYNAQHTPFQQTSTCHTAGTVASLEDRCLGQSTCLFVVTAAVMGGVPSCLGAPDARRWLAAVLKCGSTPTDEAAPVRPRSRVGIGWKFVIFVVFCFAAYFGFGIFYNVKNLGAKGLEAIPHREMWMDLPYLVRDGVIFSVDTIKSKGRTVQYDAVL